jgi:hypothetical protein
LIWQEIFWPEAISFDRKVYPLTGKSSFVFKSFIFKRTDKVKNSFLITFLNFFFLVRDGLYNHPCVSVLLYSVFCLCGLRFQNSQRNLYWGKPVLAKISCKVQTAGQVHYKCTVYRGWNKQPWNCSKESVCSPVPLPRICMRVPDSCSICRACLFIFIYFQYFVWNIDFFQIAFDIKGGVW